MKTMVAPPIDEEFMEALKRGDQLKPFPGETPPPGRTWDELAKQAREISDKFPFSGENIKNDEV